MGKRDSESERPMTVGAAELMSSVCPDAALADQPHRIVFLSHRYQLTKLRGKGLLRKVAGRNRYTLTDRGYRAALYCTKLHERLLSPTLDSLDRAVRPVLVASSHQIDRALVDLNTHFDHLAELSDMKLLA
jgi:hypothetical protein